MSTPVRRPDAPELRLYREIAFELDTTQSLSYLEGRAVPYGVEADTGWWYLETHAPGEFTDSIARTPDLPLLLFHDQHSFPIGVADEWAETEAELRGVWRLDDDPMAQRAARSARGGSLVGMSIGFAPERSAWEYAGDEWNPDDPATYDRVTRLQSRLLETSLTPTPVYEDARVTLTRSLDGRRRRHMRPPAAAGRARSAVRSATPNLDRYRALRDTLTR